MFENPVVKEILDWLIHIAIAVIIGLLIVTYVAQRTVVFKHSMEPTLYEGDNLIVEKITPRFGKLNRGDIVVIKDASPYLAQEGKEIIKRIIAIEGDTIELKDGMVILNGEILEEDYIKDGFTPASPDPGLNKLKVSEGYVYVLGDNRINSTDSRTIGPVESKKIRGKAIFRFYPFKKAGVLK